MVNDGRQSAATRVVICYTYSGVKRTLNVVCIRTAAETLHICSQLVRRVRNTVAYTVMWASFIQRSAVVASAFATVISASGLTCRVVDLNWAISTCRYSQETSLNVISL